MKDPWVMVVKNGVQIYSGNPKDAVPFWAIRMEENDDRVYIQTPGGGSLVISKQTAINFALQIIQLVNNP